MGYNFWTKIGDFDHCGMVVGKNLDRIFFYQGSKIGTAVNTAHSFSLVQVLYPNNQYIEMIKDKFVSSW